MGTPPGPHLVLPVATWPSLRVTRGTEVGGGSLYSPLGLGDSPALRPRGCVLSNVKVEAPEGTGDPRVGPPRDCARALGSPAAVPSAPTTALQGGMGEEIPGPESLGPQTAIYAQHRDQGCAGTGITVD